MDSKSHDARMRAVSNLLIRIDARLDVIEHSLKHSAQDVGIRNAERARAELEDAIEAVSMEIAGA